MNLLLDKVCSPADSVRLVNGTITMIPNRWAHQSVFVCLWTRSKSVQEPHRVKTAQSPTLKYSSTRRGNLKARDVTRRPAVWNPQQASSLSCFSVPVGSGRATSYFGVGFTPIIVGVLDAGVFGDMGALELKYRTVTSSAMRTSSSVCCTRAAEGA